MEPVYERGPLGERVVVEGGEHVAAVRADGDGEGQRVRCGQFAVVGAEHRARLGRPLVAVIVQRIQADVRTQPGLAVVAPAHLPARPGTAQQRQGCRAGAHGGGGRLPGEEEQDLPVGVHQHPGLDRVIRVREAGSRTGAVFEPGQQDIGAGEQVEVESDGSPGVAGAPMTVRASEDVGDVVAHRSPAASPSAAAVFEAS